MYSDALRGTIPLSGENGNTVYLLMGMAWYGGWRYLYIQIRDPDENN